MAYFGKYCDIVILTLSLRRGRIHSAEEGKLLDPSNNSSGGREKGTIAFILNEVKDLLRTFA